MKLSYKLWQKRTSDPGMVFLHGMGGTGKLWRPIAAALEDEFRIVAPDQRGHGESKIVQPSGSRSPISYSPLAYSEDVVETLEDLDFTNFLLIGHSMGVRTAAGVAHLRPTWVRGIVFIDLGFSGAAGGGLGEGLANFLKILPPTFDTRQQARTFLETHCPDPAIAQYLLAVTEPSPSDAAPGRIGFPFDKAALIETIAAASHSSVRNWVKEAAENGIKILVLRGQKSLVWDEEAFTKEKESFRAYPQVQFETFLGAGHGLPFEKRAEFVSRIRAFYQEILRRT